jgi:hypothetical protein
MILRRGSKDTKDKDEERIAAATFAVTNAGVAMYVPTHDKPLFLILDVSKSDGQQQRAGAEYSINQQQ